MTNKTIHAISAGAGAIENAAHDLYIPNEVPQEYLSMGLMFAPSHYHDDNESADSIFDVIKDKKSLFVRSGSICEIKDGEIAQVTADGFRTRLLDYAGKKLYKLKSDGKGNIMLVASSLTKDAANMLLAAYQVDSLPPIKIISKAPMLVKTEDGCAVTGYGYNELAGGIYVTRKAAIPEMPLYEAVALIQSLYNEVEFASDADKSRCIAMLITPALSAGGFITGYVPIQMNEAKESQSGKTRNFCIRASVYGEQEKLIVKKNGGVGSLDESLGAIFKSGARFPLMDNVRGRIDSELLEAAITSPHSVPIRLPHKGNEWISIEGISLGISSNGVNLTRDQGNRVCMVRFRKRKDHTFTSYPEGDQIAHIKANWTRYLSAVFAVVKHWVSEGMPRDRGIGHDFTEWAGAVQYICKEYFGLPDPLGGHIELVNRTSDPNLNFMRKICVDIEKEGRLGDVIFAHDIGEIADLSPDIEWPGKEPFNEDARNQTVGRIMAKIFKDSEVNMIEDYQVERDVKWNPDRARDEKNYKITKPVF